jgi:hypothetical protein
MQENSEQGLTAKSISGDVAAVQQDVAGLEQVAAEEAPAVQAEFNQDWAAWTDAKKALVEVGHRAEDAETLLMHLWNRGVAVVSHKETVAASPLTGD